MSYNESFRKLMVYPVPVVGTFDSLNVAPLDDSLQSPPPVLSISQPVVSSFSQEEAVTISSSAIVSLGGIRENVQTQFDIHNACLLDVTENFWKSKLSLDSVIDGNNCTFVNSRITNVRADTITGRVGTIDNVSCLTASITNMYGNASLNDARINTASIVSVSATNASLTNIKSTLQLSKNASFENVSITTASLVHVNAVTASLGTVQSDRFMGTNASFNSVSVNTASMLNIYSEKAEVIDANFVDLFSQNANFGGIACGILNNIPYDTFGYLANVTSDIQTQIEHLKLIGGLSMGNYDLGANNYFATINDVSTVNACLHNVSLNYWSTASHVNAVINGSNASFVNACVSNISSVNASFENVTCNTASLGNVSCTNASLTTASSVLLLSTNASFNNACVQTASVVQLSASNACFGVIGTSVLSSTTASFSNLSTNTASVTNMCVTNTQQALNVSFSNASITTASLLNLSATNASLTNVSSTLLVCTTASIVNASVTNASLGNVSVQNCSIVNVTSQNHTSVFSGINTLNVSRVNNIESRTLSYIGNLSSDVQAQINNLVLFSNLYQANTTNSTINASIQSLSGCLQNISTNFWKLNNTFASIFNGSDGSFNTASINNVSILNLSCTNGTFKNLGGASVSGTNASFTNVTIDTASFTTLSINGTKAVTEAIMKSNNTFAYATDYCQIKMFSIPDLVNTLEFRVNNITPDAQIVCTQGNQGQYNDGNLIYYAKKHVFTGTASLTNLNTVGVVSTNASIVNLSASNVSFANIESSVQYSTNASITNLSATNVSVTNMSSTLVLSANASFGNACVTTASITNLSATNVSVTNVSSTLVLSTNASFSNACITTASLMYLSATNASVTNVSSALVLSMNASFSNACVTTASITNLSATNVSVTNVSSTLVLSTNVSFSNACVTTASVTNLSATNASVTNVSSTLVLSTNVSFANACITTASVTNLSATNASLTNVSSTLVLSMKASFSNASVTTASIMNLSATNVSVTNVSSTLLLSTNASFSNASVTTASVMNLSATNASVTNVSSTLLLSTNASFSNASVTTASIMNLSATNVSVTNVSSTLILSTNASFSNASVTTASITNLSATNASVTNVSCTLILSTNASFSNASVTTASITNLSVTNASLTNVSSTLVLSNNVSFNNACITTASVTNLSATNASVTNVSSTLVLSTNASFGNACITTASVTNLSATDASVTNVSSTLILSTNASFINVSITTASVTNLSATNASVINVSSTLMLSTNASFSNASVTTASIMNLSATNASVTNVSSTLILSTNASFSNASVTTASITNLSATNASVTNVSSTLLLSTNASFSNVSITNASVTNLSVTNASVINVSSTLILSTNASFSNVSVITASITNLSATNVSLINVSMITASTVNISAINASLLYTTIDNVSVNKTLTIIGDDAATQKWTKSNATFAYVSPSCYIGLNSQLGNNWLSFYANNTVADAQITCNNGTSGAINTGVLNYNASAHVFTGKIQTTAIIAPTNTLKLSYLNSGNHLEVSTVLDTGTIIDFHSNPAATDGQYVDYDSRILSIGGTTGTPGNGALKYIAASHNFNNTLNASLITSAFIGCLILRVFYGSKGYIIQKTLISTFSNYVTTYNNVGQYFSHRICGFIKPLVTGTYTFRLTADDGAELYVNDIMLIRTPGYDYPTTGSIALDSSAWYPIMINYSQGNGAQYLTFEYYNGSAYVRMAHNTGFQFAYDQDDTMINRLGPITVNGEITTNGNINMSSNTLVCSDVTLNGSTVSTTYAKLYAPIFTGLSTFNGNVTLGSNTLTCNEVTLNGSTVSTTYAKLYAPTFTGLSTFNGNVTLGSNTLTCGNVNATMITSMSVGYLIHRVFYNPNQAANPLDLSDAFKGYLIQKSLINTINFYNSTYNSISTNFAARINGYICPGQTSTYTFQLNSTETAVLYINDSLITYSSYSVATSNTISLTAGVWYPIVIEHTHSTIGNERLQINYKNTINTTYTAFTHSTGTSGIQFAYDQDENIVSRVGTLNVDGTLTVNNNTDLGSNTLTCGTVNANMITSSSVGYLLQRVFNNNNFTTNALDYSNAFKGYLITKLLINTINTTNATYNTINSNFAVRISGYICPGATSTYTFQLSSTDNAVLYINDSLITSSSVTPTSNTISLIADRWYPIVIEHVQGNTVGSERLLINFKNSTNVSSYTTLTHSTGATGIQFAYDQDEAMMSRVGTFNVDGTLTVNGNATLGSNTLTCNEITLNGSTVSTAYAKLYAPSFTGTPTIGGSSILKLSDLGSLSANIVTTGNITANNAYITTNVYAGYSDDRLKTDKYPLSDVLRVLPNLSTFNYYPNTSFCRNLGIETKNEREIGMSAQEVSMYFPEVVCPAPCDVTEDELSGETYSRTGLNLLTIRYERLVPVLFQAIRELNEKIERLEKRVMFLELK